MMNLCPHCGGDICLDEAIESGPLKMLPYGAATWNGEPLPLTRQQAALLFALLKANGAPVSRLALAERMGCESDDPSNTVDVQLCRMRQTFAQAGTVLPVETVRGVGLRWAA